MSISEVKGDTNFLSQPVFEKIQNIYDHLLESDRQTQNTQPFAGSLQKLVENSGASCELQAGEILFREKDFADSVYWIETGVLAILQGDLKNPRLLGFRYPGQVVGEIALLENIPRTASIAAIIPTQLKSLTRDEFHETLEHFPGVGIEIMRMLSARLREIQPADFSSGLFDHLEQMGMFVLGELCLA